MSPAALTTEPCCLSPPPAPHAHTLQAIKCMPPGVEQWVWVCDFYGFGMADVNPKLAKVWLGERGGGMHVCMIMVVGGRGEDLCAQLMVVGGGEGRICVHD